MKKMLFIVLLVAPALSGCVNTSSVLIREPDLGALADGMYRGDSTVGPVYANVRVEMEAGRIMSFTIIEHRTLLGKKAEVLAKRVVEKQTLELDAVSGATVSSKAILKAGQNALQGVPQ